MGVLLNWSNTFTAENKILKSTASICQVNSEENGLLMMAVQIVKCGGVVLAMCGSWSG